MYKPHLTCRACGYGHKKILNWIKASESDEKMNVVVDFGMQPLANDFCEVLEERAGFAPLRVVYCKQCGLAQLSVVIDPGILYSKYAYITSTSNTMQQHFEALTKDLSAYANGNKTVLEIGSNDGTFLSFLKEHGFKVCGVDPAKNLCEIAESNGLEIENQFFTAEFSKRLSVSNLVIARHVFAHVHDWNDFIAALENVTDNQSIVAIEVPYAVNMVSKCGFDTVYHEHLSYVTVSSVVRLLRGTKFYVQNVIEYPIHGGSIVLFIKRLTECSSVNSSVSYFMHRDVEASPEAWLKMNERSHSLANQLKRMVGQLLGDGKRIGGCCAPAKATVLCNLCGFDKSQIEFITDNTPQKQGKLLPGTDIPVKPENELLLQYPDYAILFAWNFKDELLEKNKRFMELGGKFLIPNFENCMIEIYPT